MTMIDNDNDLFALNTFTMNGNGKPINNKRNKTKYKWIQMN